MTDPPNRRPSITDEVHGDGFDFAITVGFDPEFGNPCEVFLTKRGKSGSALETTLYEIGVLASKMMQENDQSHSQILIHCIVGTGLIPPLTRLIP